MKRFITKSYITAALLLALALLLPCLLVESGPPARKHYRFSCWPAVNDEVDSLTNDIELGFADNTSLPDMQGRLARLKAAMGNDQESRHRIAYFNLIILTYTKGVAAAHAETLRLYAQVDSAKEPYLYHRLLMRLTINRGNSPENFNNLTSNMLYFKSLNDSLTMAKTYNHLMRIAAETNDFQLAADMSAKARYFYSKLGLDVKAGRCQVVEMRNRLNSNPNDKATRDSALLFFRNFLSSRQSEIDYSAAEIARRSIYELTGGREILLANLAYALKHKETHSNVSMNASLLAMDYLKTGRLDSAAFYSDMAMKHYPLIEYNLHRPIVLLNHAMVLKANNQVDSAFKYMLMRNAELDTLQKLQDINKFKRIQIKHRGERIGWEKDALRAAERQNLIIVISALTVVLLLVALIALYVRNRHLRRIYQLRQNMKEKNSEVHLLSVMVDEREKSLEQIKTHLNTAKDDKNKGSEEVISTLERQLKINDASRKKWNTSFEILKANHQEFVAALYAKCGKLPTSMVRHALYIAMGLNVQEVAELMNVQPASIYQSRWRLKKKLNLADDESLAIYLSSLLTSTSPS